VAGGGVELPAAGDELQSAVAVEALDLLGGKLCLQVGLHVGDD